MTIFTPEFIAEQKKMAKKAYMAEASDADVGLYRSYAAVYYSYAAAYYPKALAEIERLKAKLAKRNKSKWHPASERPKKFQECIVLDKNKRVHNWIHDDALLR